MKKNRTMILLSIILIFGIIFVGCIFFISFNSRNFSSEENLNTSKKNWKEETVIFYEEVEGIITESKSSSYFAGGTHNLARKVKVRVEKYDLEKEFEIRGYNFKKYKKGKKVKVEIDGKKNSKTNKISNRSINKILEIVE